MHDVVPSPRYGLASLKPLSPNLSAEVRDWVTELRVVWVATGLSMNQFASIYPIDKGTVSRYLNGERVPADRWFLDKLLAMQADSGKPVTNEVREHFTGLHMRALETAHPHEYRVRRVKDALEAALTGKREAERYVEDLTIQLVERNREIQELNDDKRRLRAAMDDDYERLCREVEEITHQRELARERASSAERRCEMLEGLLDDMEVDPDAVNEGKDSPFPVHNPEAVSAQLRKLQVEGKWDQIVALAEKAAAHAPVSDVRQLGELINAMREVGAMEEGGRLAHRASTAGRLSRDDLRRLEPEALVHLLRNLHAVGADDLVRWMAEDAVSCAWRGTKNDVQDIIHVLNIAGREDQATKLAREAWQMQVKSG
jgi:hypothetical protein